ncbi:MAG: tetratricopeptide repeat protein [Clostridium sp.]|nr:tetratricopeptide repeat protein [Clostridium sp.]
MAESNQEGYQTLGWIINKSDSGLFLVAAKEEIQEEIADVYRGGMIGIYDCRRYPGEYSFQKLKNWIMDLKDIQTVFIVNFQLAVQEEQDLKRLNFSRDMLTGLGKNLIFFTTPYGDDKLATGAYDFYSFIKIRIIFHDYMSEERERTLERISQLEKKARQNIEREGEWNSIEIKEKLAEAYSWIQKAKEAGAKGEYQESAELLLKVGSIREKILGTEHLETVAVYNELANVYVELGLYEKAEKLCCKVLQVREKALGESNPDTVKSYNDLAAIYGKQGKYKKAEELYKKALSAHEKMAGEKNCKNKDFSMKDNFNHDSIRSPN